MNCPKCGGYSPYNTSVCNRCGASLTGGRDRLVLRRVRYRRAQAGRLDRIKNRVIEFADKKVDEIKADKTKRIIALSVLAAAAMLMLTLVGCSVSCMCGGGDKTPVSPTDTPSASDDRLVYIPPAVTSSADISASDMPTGGVSSADVQ